MNILLIHQAFASPGDPGGTRHYEMGLRLARHGHGFAVVASDLSYHTGRRVAGSSGWIAEQNLEGVRILRAYTYPSIHRSFAWRVVSFVSFMISSLVATFRVRSVDMVIGTSPPIFQAVSAWVVAVLRRKPFLLEIRDLWPSFAIDIGVLKNPVLIRLSRRLERFLYRQADHLLVNSPAYREYLIAQGVPKPKISLIPNGVDPGVFSPEAPAEGIRESLGLKDKFIVTYAGALGLANDLETLLKAAAKLENQKRIHFLIVGEGKEQENLWTLAQALDLQNVTFLGSRPKEEMPTVLAASDACLAILRDIPMFRTTYPNKVFDYMAAGKPTLLAIDGVIREVMESSGGGIFVPPGNPEALADAVLEVSQNTEKAFQMGKNARNYVVRHFNRDEQALRFEELLLRLSCQAGARRGFYARGGKRILDLSLAIPAFIVLLPLMLLISIAIFLTIGGPVLFRQIRPGLGGKPFEMYKFRTMLDFRDKRGNLLPDAQRLTRLGRFLRSLSLDELPTLYNVIRGDISLVGPRPLLMQYLDRYTPEQARRNEVLPGVTGWAQVRGRNAISWEEKFKLDVWYVQNICLQLDIQILWRTVLQVLKRDGVSALGHATMPEFKGSRIYECSSN